MAATLISGGSERSSKITFPKISDQMIAATRAERYTYLDLARGLSAITVLITHYCWLYTNGEMDSNRMPTWALPLKSLLWPLYAHGGLAVQVFWILSGIIFFIRYGSSRMDVRKFIIWRVARLYPLHLATLLLIAIIQFVSLHTVHHPQIFPNNDARHFALNLIMASNWVRPSEASFNAPIWSVSIEILVYAGFVAYVKFLKATLPKTLILFVLLAAAYRVTSDLRLLCGSLFFLGGLLVQGLDALRSILGTALSPVSAVAAAVVLIGLPITGIGPHIVLIYFLEIPAVMLLALALDAGAPPIPKSARWIGDITYSTYLMHMPILMIARLWLDRQPDRYAILDSIGMLLAYLAVVLIVSLAVHRSFELPMQKWIQDRFHAGRAKTAIEREETQTI